MPCDTFNIKLVLLIKTSRHCGLVDRTVVGLSLAIPFILSKYFCFQKKKKKMKKRSFLYRNKYTPLLANNRKTSQIPKILLQMRTTLK